MSFLGLYKSSLAVRHRHFGRKYPDFHENGNGGGYQNMMVSPFRRMGWRVGRRRSRPSPHHFI